MDNPARRVVAEITCAPARATVSTNGRRAYLLVEWRTVCMTMKTSMLDMDLGVMDFLVRDRQAPVTVRVLEPTAATVQCTFDVAILLVRGALAALAPATTD